MKVNELFSETLIGAVVQMYAAVTATESPGALPLISIAMSIMTSAYASATISYDLDTDPENRKMFPGFFGK